MNRPDDVTMKVASDLLKENGFEAVWEWLAWLEAEDAPRREITVTDRMERLGPAAPFVAAVREWARNRTVAEDVRIHELGWYPDNSFGCRVSFRHGGRAAARGFDWNAVVSSSRDDTADAHWVFALLDRMLMGLVCPPIVEGRRRRGPPLSPSHLRSSLTLPIEMSEEMRRYMRREAHL